MYILHETKVKTKPEIYFYYPYKVISQQVSVSPSAQPFVYFIFIQTFNVARCWNIVKYIEAITSILIMSLIISGCLIFLIKIL